MYPAVLLLFSTSAYCVIMVDFNFLDIDWITNATINSRACIFLDGLADRCIYQIETLPTRGNPILDLVWHIARVLQKIWLWKIIMNQTIMSRSWLQDGKGKVYTNANFKKGDSLKHPLCITCIVQSPGQLWSYWENSYMCKVVITWEKPPTSYKVRPCKSILIL